MKFNSYIKSVIKKIHQKFFIKKKFFGMHLFLYQLSLNGLGMLNCKNGLEGEDYFLEKIVVKNSEAKIIFDVGANNGEYSKMVRKLMPSSTIYSFEPHPKTYQRLLEKSKDFNLNINNVACGEKKDKLKLYDFKENDGSTGASIYKEAIERLFKSDTVEYEVDVIKLDDFANENCIEKIDLLKIDTEGHELNVLYGARNLINNKAVDYIQFEFNNIHAISRVFMKDFFDLLENYNFYRMLPDGLIRLSEYNPIFLEIFAFQNIVAIRKEIDKIK